MRRQTLLIILLPFALLTAASAQQRGKPDSKKPAGMGVRPEHKKYPSLLWEITGNGLKKPSYLFGTMHVSDKLAFHLGDSFYRAIKSVDVVALETNPEDWQDDFSRSVFYKTPAGLDVDFISVAGMGGPDDRLKITSFAIDDYEEAMKAALAVEPSMINGMLYRTYGTQTDDFEEDTYLDLYIFQTGKKLGKRLTGVENFDESEKLVMEAYLDMMKGGNRKKKSYDFEGMFTNPKKVEDAYRRGDLDLLDSLEALTVFSDAFQEKFLYKRNDIQTNSIDSIVKKSSLFAAVGAAHLPGKRGVIELLRKKGYTLRPVLMDERNSFQKEMIDRTRHPVSFTAQTAKDNFYQVNIPGKKFYEFTEWSGIDVVQYADMVNGAYYMVTRIKTNSGFWGHSPERIRQKIDTLLYENIPGKILKKTPIVRNGYKGWEISNRTRRGDNQRYNLYITPFEIIVFKMSGNGDYITKGDEAQKFFGSVKMKEYNEAVWINYKPEMGGFSVRLPHEPSVLKDGNFGTDRLEYAAFDKKDGSSYLIMKSDVHNYSFAEEDVFDLNLMSESYTFSTFIDKELSRGFSKLNGYPALDCKYRHKDGSMSKVKYIIRGPLYYVVIAHYKNETDHVNRFLESFALTPFIYPEAKPQSDTTLHYTVQSPVAVYKKDEGRYNGLLELARLYEEEEDGEEYDFFRGGNLFKGFKTAMVGNDTTGEKIFVTYNAPGNYNYIKDTASLLKKLWNNEDSSFIYRMDKKYNLSGGGWCREVQLSDTGSSRMILSKTMYHEGHVFTLTSLTDTLSRQSTFLDKFFSTFTPADTLKKESLFTRKTAQFFNDYFSTDSVIAKKARKSLYEISFDSADVPLLKQAIGRLSWNTKNYLEAKKHFISELAELKDSSITPFLVDLYWKVKDSADLQNLILKSLLEQKTHNSFKAFVTLITTEPPIIGEETNNYSMRRYLNSHIRLNGFNFPGRRYGAFVNQDPRFGGPWPDLYDTLSLAKVVFPDILQLINIDDYKSDVLNLLAVMVDSGYLKAPDYEQHFSKLYLDAKQLMKKQVAKEEENNIEKASRKDKPKSFYDDEDEEEEMEEGNDELEQYAVLLLPFLDKNPTISSFFEQLVRTKDRELQYRIFILMLRNKRPVSDTLFTYFAKQDKYRAELYGDLKKMKTPDRFPSAWKSQPEIARSMFLADIDDYQKPDSVVYLDKLPVSYKNKNGWVYFFKYKAMRDDTYWQLGSVGMQPDSLANVDTDNNEFTERGDRKMENDKAEKEQMEKMLKELLYAKRSSAAEFYNARSYNLYKVYLSEMVKRYRYKD